MKNQVHKLKLDSYTGDLCTEHNGTSCVEMPHIFRKRNRFSVHQHNIWQTVIHSSKSQFLFSVSPLIYVFLLEIGVMHQWNLLTNVSMLNLPPSPEPLGRMKWISFITKQSWDVSMFNVHQNNSVFEPWKECYINAIYCYYYVEARIIPRPVLFAIGERGWERTFLPTTHRQHMWPQCFQC